MRPADPARMQARRHPETVAEVKEAGATTALMRQYLDVKAQVPDAILFFRLGDFYEMFYEDAVLVAGLLSLTLTSRDKGKEDPVPMCGIPHHAARAYLQRLTELGHRVAICEQLEDPKLTKGIVKRGVVRIVTPGVILDEESLDARTPNYLVAIEGERSRGFGVAFLDVTTGDLRATVAASTESMLDELARIDPREVVFAKGDETLAPLLRRAYPRLTQTPVAAAAEPPESVLREILGDAIAGPRQALALAAAARVLTYARSTQLAAPLPVAKLEIFDRADHLVLDEQARAHLELTETMLERRREGSLLGAIDLTRSAIGARLLRRWLLFPLRAVAPIRRRQDAVERLVLRPSGRGAVRKVLGEIGDIERLASRARLGVATPRDLAALGRSLARLPALHEALGLVTEDLPVTEAKEDLLRLGEDRASELAKKLSETLIDEAPANTKEGGFIRSGLSPELDRLRQVAAGGRELVAEIETRERERTGIPSLKVKYNNVFGYYIEITRAKMGQVPADYQRKQTVANAERFVTSELSDLEGDISRAEEQRIALELRLFEALRTEVGAAAARLQAIAAQVAAIDGLAALAEVAHHHGYVRPVVDESVTIELEAARHPVIERLVGDGGFVPNDLKLDGDDAQLLLVTGPNMAGKSTVMRQTALAVILAQMGGFVPARSARIGLCDRVFTRVGAGDNLSRGESTFLVEMRETAHILRHATARSLVVLDEIGRGTSTYDGVSIAWAVAEHLHDKIGARTLFATHYHELCALADTHRRVRNVSVAAREWKGEIVFLRQLTPGGANRSFGVDVAKLAGLPPDVVARARGILATLEAGGADRGPQTVSPERGTSPQLGLWEATQATPAVASPSGDDGLSEIAEALRRVDPDDLSPRAAHELLVRLREKLTDPRARGPS